MTISRYSTHIPLHRWQKGAVALCSGIGSILNPHRADLVAASNETMGESAFSRVYEQMKQSDQGQSILKEQPIITDATLEQCRNMKSGTFGAEYAAFMDARNFKPSDRPPVRFIDDPEVAYVALRYRQVHDFWHVLFECPTNITGEVAVKIIEGIQLGLPNAMLASVFAPVLVGSKQRSTFYTVLFPWAVRAGFKAINLMNIYYEHHFEENMNDLQRQWCLSKAPHSF